MIQEDDDEVDEENEVRTDLIRKYGYE